MADTENRYSSLPPLWELRKHPWLEAGIFQLSLKSLLFVLLLQLSPAAVTSVWDHGKLDCLNSVVSAGAWHLNSSIIIMAIRADLSTKQRLSCGLLYEGHLRQQTVPATPYGSGRRLQAAKLSHILSKPLISGLIFAKIHDRNRSLLTWQLVLTNSIAFFHVEPPAAYTLIPHNTKWEVKV